MDYRKSSGQKDQNPHQVPILWTIKKRNRDMVLLLVRFEHQRNWRNNDGWGPLLFASQHDDDEVIVKLLIDAGADLDSRDIQGWRPLSLAAVSGHERNVELIVGIILS